MTPKRFIGYIMLATPFVVLFGVMATLMGLLPIVAIAAGVALLSWWIFVAVELIS